MPTRKVSDREKLTLFARSAGDAELEEAYEIISIERRVRASAKQPKKQPTGDKKTTSAKKNEKAKDPATNADPTDGPEQ